MNNISNKMNPGKNFKDAIRCDSFIETHKQLHCKCDMREFFIEQGWYKLLKANDELPISAWIKEGAWDLVIDALDSDEIILKQIYWKRHEEAIKPAVTFLVENVIQKELDKVKLRDFGDNNLSGILSTMPKPKLLHAIRAAYPNAHSWEIGTGKHKRFESKAVRKEALDWILGETSKEPKELTNRDFTRLGLHNLIEFFKDNGKAYGIVHEFYPEIRPWEMKVAMATYFDLMENRIEAVAWLADKTGKHPKELTKMDFIRNGLNTLINAVYKGNARLAYTEYRGQKAEEWNWSKAPTGFFKDESNRVEAIARLCETLEKDVYELKYRDVWESPAATVLRYHNQSIKSLREELGPLVRDVMEGNTVE